MLDCPLTGAFRAYAVLFNIRQHWREGCANLHGLKKSFF